MSKRYRVGGHWSRHSVIKIGNLPPDENGRRPDDELAAVVVNCDPTLARRIVDGLNREGDSDGD